MKKMHVLIRNGVVHLVKMKCKIIGVENFKAKEKYFGDIVLKIISTL